MNRKQRRADKKRVEARPAMDVGGLFAEAMRLHQAGRLEEAGHLYRQVLASDPRHADSLHLLGVIAGQRGRGEAAVELIRKAIAARPGFAEAYFNLGLTLSRIGRVEEAVGCLNQALTLQPNDPDNHFNLGVVLAKLGRLAEAVAAYDRAIALRPGSPHAHFNRANALRDLGRADDAIAAYERAAQVNPRFADAYLNRAALFYDLNRPADAIADYQRALALKPDAEFVPGFVRYLKSRLCDWSNFTSETAAIFQGLSEGRRVAQPAQVVPIARDDADMLRAAQVWVAAKIAGPPAAAPGLRAKPGGKIRLGYFSADLHAHATAYLAAELFERHDRDRFEVVAFSFGPRLDDPMRRRLTAAFDRFEEVSQRTDEEIAQLARDMGVDIAIDLKGYTQDARYGVFARRAAPIQVNFLGFPGTMGAGFMDYVIADQVVIPSAARACFTEKVVWLPHSYQPNDSQRRTGPPVGRADFGLPEQTFVFASFNNLYKLTPQTFDSWTRILRAAPDSVLWIYCDQAEAADNLRREAQARGVDPRRLVFTGRLPQEEHLARLKLADLFLDTTPCSAHTTASDALWAGLPVLTQPGGAFTGRVATSLLRAIGLPELVVESAAAYEALAVDLALNLERITALKRKLAANRDTTPLFDAEGYARHLEAAYLAMVERRRAGLPADHIRIEA